MMMTRRRKTDDVEDLTTVTSRSVRVRGFGGNGRKIKSAGLDVRGPNDLSRENGMTTASALL